MKIVAIDPGGTTGVVCCEVEAESVESQGSVSALTWALAEGKLKALEINCRDVYFGFKKLRAAIDDFSPHVIVCEGFELWTMAADLTPVKLIALLEWNYDFNAGIVGGGCSFVVQMPSERSVITVDRLKAWGLYGPFVGKKDALAAMQHLVVYLRKMGKVD